MTANTVLSDINELYTGFILAGSKWFDPDAKIQYDVRVKQAQPNEITISQGQAVEMAKEFLKWAKNNGYRGSVKNVWWTARAGSMLRAYVCLLIKREIQLIFLCSLVVDLIVDI